MHLVEVLEDRAVGELLRVVGKQARFGICGFQLAQNSSLVQIKDKRLTAS